MNRRNCMNCETTWTSLADEQLEAPHTCPRCGDELMPIGQAQQPREALLVGAACGH